MKSKPTIVFKTQILPVFPAFGLHFVAIGIGCSQILIPEDSDPSLLSSFENSIIANVGIEGFSLNQLIGKKSSLDFQALLGPNTNLGITSDTY